MNFRTRALSSAIIAVLATGSAIAADPAVAPDEAKNTEPKALDEIQVTATKRETPLQKTAIAITPISADMLDKERVTDVADITKLVPGFAATTQGDHDVITLTLRGIGNDSAKTEYADPEVALFVDGVYTPRAEAAAGLLLDLESVEALRGPQGTLWGRNSTVGAVNFQTAKPELGVMFGNVQGGLGSYDRVGMRGAFNVPLSDTLAMRASFVHEQHDGYVNYQRAPH